MMNMWNSMERNLHKFSTQLVIFLSLGVVLFIPFVSYILFFTFLFIFFPLGRKKSGGYLCK